MGNITILLFLCIFMAMNAAHGYVGYDSKGEEARNSSLRIRSRVKRVIGGDLAKDGGFPHQVSLHAKKRRPDESTHYCSASIIHPMLLVTGAGCLGDQNNISGIQAIAGLQSLSSRQGDARQVRNVIHAYVYKYNHTTFDNDIAILVLNQSLVLGEKVRAIRLRDPTWELPGHAVISGWGETGFGREPDLLNVARVPIIDKANCTEIIGHTGRAVYTITENMICAGGAGADSTTGDSGGPLTCSRIGIHGKEEPYLCGVVSWGFPSRYRGKFPGVYTDVSKYTGWIGKLMLTWERHYWITTFGKPSGGPRDCGEGNFRCPNNDLCIPWSFICNGRNDCHPLENWDERDCRNITCGRGKFKCKSIQLCIPSIYVCDGDGDCADGSDELNCM